MNVCMNLKACIKKIISLLWFENGSLTQCQVQGLYDIHPLSRITDDILKITTLNDMISELHSHLYDNA